MRFCRFLPDRIRECLQRQAINFLAKDLFNTVSEDEVLKIDPQEGKVYYGEKELDVAAASDLKESADKVYNSPLWRLMKNEVKYLSNKHMFEDGATGSANLAGKMALWTLKVLDEKLKHLKDL